MTIIFFNNTNSSNDNVKGLEWCTYRELSTQHAVTLDFTEFYSQLQHVVLLFGQDLLFWSRCWIWDCSETYLEQVCFTTGMRATVEPHHSVAVYISSFPTLWSGGLHQLYASVSPGFAWSNQTWLVLKPLSLQSEKIFEIFCLLSHGSVRTRYSSSGFCVWSCAVLVEPWSG